MLALPGGETASLSNMIVYLYKGKLENEGNCHIILSGQVFTEMVSHIQIWLVASHGFDPNERLSEMLSTTDDARGCWFKEEMYGEQEQMLIRAREQVPSLFSFLMP